MEKETHYIIRSSIARRILEYLDNNKNPLSPKQIAQKINVARDNVSTRIIKLAKIGLVECVNPEVRSWRFYRITKNGKAVLKEAQKLLVTNSP